MIVKPLHHNYWTTVTSSLSVPVHSNNSPTPYFHFNFRKSQRSNAAEQILHMLICDRKVGEWQHSWNSFETLKSVFYYHVSVCFSFVLFSFRFVSVAAHFSVYISISVNVIVIFSLTDISVSVNGNHIVEQVTADCSYTSQWAPLSPKIAPFHRGSGPHVTHDSLGPSEHTNQKAPPSVQPFLHRRLQSVPLLYNETPFPRAKLPLSMADLDHHLIHGSLAHPSPQPKWHLDRFSLFSRAH